MAAKESGNVGRIWDKPCPKCKSVSVEVTRDEPSMKYGVCRECGHEVLIKCDPR